MLLSPLPIRPSNVHEPTYVLIFYSDMLQNLCCVSRLQLKQFKRSLMKDKHTWKAELMHSNLLMSPSTTTATFACTTHFNRRSVLDIIPCIIERNFQRSRKLSPSYLGSTYDFGRENTTPEATPWKAEHPFYPTVVQPSFSGLQTLTNMQNSHFIVIYE
jgi:hypothetical protein